MRLAAAISCWCLGALLLSAVASRGAAAGPRKQLQLFLLIGQSNMAGRGAVEPADREPVPHIFKLTETHRWEAASDPIHFDKPKIAGVGPGLSFAQCLVEADPSLEIGLIPAAVGGTSLDEWVPGGKLYTDALARARIALRDGRLAGILWHQGEADSAPEKAETYARRFRELIAHLRADLNAPQVPVIVGETGRFRKAGIRINAVLAALPDEVSGCAFVSAENLTHGGDGTHFDRASARELGRRFANAWLALRERR